MRKVGHVSDDFPKGILLPKAELPWDPGPSHLKPVLLSLNLAASPTHILFSCCPTVFLP